MNHTYFKKSPLCFLVVGHTKFEAPKLKIRKLRTS